MDDKILPDKRLLLDSIRDYLEQLREEGLEGLPISESASMARDPSPEAPPRTAAPRPAASDSPAVPQSQPVQQAKSAAELFSKYPGLEKTADLRAVEDFIGACTRCKLHGGRTNLVFGVGNPNAELVFVGEGPGADEDAQGEPFVGRAGQLLTDIIERGMGVRRADVYICNVVKCRPPGNRNPEPDEVAACEPFLFRQLELINPKAIVGLGTFAVQCLLREKTPISKLRGKWREVRGIRMMPTFHPAYLLRNPADKRLVWADVQDVMRFLGWPIPKRGQG
jgi:uracil-DNA glycosylase